MNPPSEIDRQAFNTAFHELGLRWHWDVATYDALARQAAPCAAPTFAWADPVRGEIGI